MEKLLKADGIAQVLNAVDKRGQSALHRAACQGHLGVCKLLLADGETRGKVDVNMKDGEWNTALHLACEEDRGAVAEFLIMTAGARLDVENRRRMTPIEVCVSKPLAAHLKLLSSKHA